MLANRIVAAALVAVLSGGACGSAVAPATANSSESTALAPPDSVPTAVTTMVPDDVVAAVAIEEVSSDAAVPPGATAQDFQELFAIAPGLEVIVRSDDGSTFAVTSGSNGTQTSDRVDAPSIRLPLDVIADPALGRGDVLGARIAQVLGALDVFWTGHGYHSVVPAGSDVDLIEGQRPVGLDVAPGGIVVSVGSDGDPNRSRTLRRIGVGAPWGLEPSEIWTVEFDDTVLFFDVLSAGQIVVGTAEIGHGPSESASHAHVLNGTGDLLATVELPAGVVWIQERSPTATQTLVGCESGVSFVDGEVGWVVGERNLLTACVDGRVVDTTRWCCGMGEVFFAFDSNRDGIDEVVVGGTSVGGGGGGVYSLVGETLGAVRFDDGQELTIEFGTVGESYNKIGCADSLLVQVRVTSEGTSAHAQRSSIRIDGLAANIDSVEVTQWAHGLAGELVPGEVWDSSPTDLLEGLEPC